MNALPVNRVRAFTIVEMLVVVAVIALLVGLVMPALSGVRKRSAKTSEINNLRQVGHAWVMYGNSNNDAALPGYLTAPVQAPPVANVSRGWGVKYVYPTPPLTCPNDKAIPPSSLCNQTDNIAGPWSWRLLSYLDYSHEIIHGYAPAGQTAPTPLPDETDESIFGLVAAAQEIAERPSFGYNGYYIGGYWEMVPIGTPTPIQTPMYRYSGDCGDTDNRRLSIPTTIPQISRSAEMVTFCSAARKSNDQWSSFPAAMPIYRYPKLPSDLPGAHLVTGPFLGQEAQWRPDPLEQVSSIEILSSTAFVPLGRYTGAMAVLWADGHCDTQAANALGDQRRWINSASARDYKHIPCP